MKHYEKIKRLNNVDFKQIIGVKRETFAAMVDVLTAEYLKRHEKRRQKSKLALEKRLIMALKYLLQYPTHIVN
jgi:hypothetical protein